MQPQILYETLDLAAVESFITNGEEETLHLDFITLDSAAMSNRADKKNFAKALSGFSNSDGGVIVWGVVARPDAERIDRACGRQDVEGLARLISRLNALTGEAVNPLVDGIVHKVIPASRDKGFAATLVPASDSGPHMAKLGIDRYYKRSGSAFYRMEHFDLEDMFGRRRRPRLSLDVRLVSKGPTSAPAGVTQYGLHLFLAINNTGRGIAKSPYLVVRIPPSFSRYQYGIDGNGSQGLPGLSSAQYDVLRYGGSPAVVIHPGVSHDVTVLETKIEVDNQRRITIPMDLRLKYELAAEEISLQQGTVEITADELCRAALPASLYAR